MTWPLCCCLFVFNSAFNNFSVISRWCLVVTGSSMLTFIVLPHWSIMPQTLDMIPHPVTLSWHWVDRSQLYPVRLSAKRGTASTTFNDFGMSRPGIECVTLYLLSNRGRCDPYVRVIFCLQMVSLFPSETFCICPPTWLVQLKLSEIMLMGCKTQIKNHPYIYEWNTIKKEVKLQN